MEAPSFRKLVGEASNIKNVDIVGCCTDICVFNGAMALANYYDQENKDPTKTIKSKVNLFKEAFGKIASTVQAAVEVFKQAYAKAKEILDSASEFSRSFVSGSSAFVDTDVRDYMLRFGVGSKQAQSIIAAEEALGIDASDYALLTQGQREAFDQLMQHYQEGLDNLDTEKLEEYNQVMILN